MGQVIDTCLDLGIPVHARVIHDDLVHDRALRDPNASEPLLRFIEKQEQLKRNGEKIHTSWNLFAYQKKMLRQEPIEWTCVAGYKYFFVSSTGKFWLCSQVRTERHILEITREDLLSYNKKKSCQAGCGVYCTAETSLAVNHPLRYAGREVAGMLRVACQGMQGGGPKRIRDFDTAYAFAGEQPSRQPAHRRSQTATTVSALAEAAAQSALVNPVGLVFLRADRGRGSD